MTYYEHILSLLPHNMKEDGNAENIKKILKVISKYLEEEKGSDDLYSKLLSVHDAHGTMLDLLADMFYVYRDYGEIDEELRKRITATIISRKNGNSLKDIIDIINSVVDTGKITILENYNDLPANIYMTGYATTEEFNYIYDLVIGLLPAGVRLAVPLLRFGTWKDVKDISGTWGNIANNKYIW